ncbi:MAG: hypothetical protein NTW05_09360 [Pseudonocardiales bacterium]|nr:hypothetical protein [Pseudonocardiales bacterium]
MSTSTRPRAAQRLNALQRMRAADDPVVVDARRAAAAEALERHVRKIVDSAPPLTDEQRTKIVRLLAPASSAPADAA